VKSEKLVKLELIITDRFHRKIVAGNRLPQLIAMRPQSKREIGLARKLGIKRFYLPNLSKAEAEDFFEEVDKLWDEVIKPFGSDHPFWRNVVSSNMQEWERSASYLALVLFTLAQRGKEGSQFIVIVCSDVEEEEVIEAWAKKVGWAVYRKPALRLPTWIRRLFQEMENLKNFLYMSSICLYMKWFSPKYREESYQTENRVLITSLLYANAVNNGKYVDPFFGDLHVLLGNRGDSVTYLCGPLGDFREVARKVRECREVSVLIPYSILSWPKLALSILKVFLRRFRLPRSDFLGCDFSEVIMWNARRFEYFFNLDSEIYFRAVKELVKDTRFDRLILLYEGNVFERGCIQGLREHGKGRVVGYSHAVVFPLNLKIRLTKSEKRVRPEPDFLITPGPETKQLMTRIGNREPSGIESACSLRYIPIDIDREKQIAQPNVLVALDGVNGCATVLDWFIENADVFKG
jgi:hypothetical protein